MSDDEQTRAPLPGSYSVSKQDFGKIRMYYGLRFFVFLGCTTICCFAAAPNGSLSNEAGAAWLGLVLLLGFVLAYRFSKPALIASFALPKGGRSITVWNALGIATAVAYAANGWDYLGDDVTGLVVCLAGTAFFGIVLFSSLKMFFNPGIGGAFIQMVGEHRSRLEKVQKE